jgi:Protein of unknown function (DUF3558)
MYRTLAIVMIAAVAAASCGSPSSSGTAAANRTAAGTASAIKACELLTAEEIRQATGAMMVAGQLQTTDTQASCDWSSADPTSGASGVGVIVQEFDPALWQAMSSITKATPVAGIGQQAFKGVPHSGDLSVKQGNYAVTVGIVDFKHDNATVDAAALQLMKLVLSRL